MWNISRLKDVWKIEFLLWDDSNTRVTPSYNKVWIEILFCSPSVPLSWGWQFQFRLRSISKEQADSRVLQLDFLPNINLFNSRGEIYVLYLFLFFLFLEQLSREILTSSLRQHHFRHNPYKDRHNSIKKKQFLRLRNFIKR